MKKLILFLSVLFICGLAFARGNIVSSGNTISHSPYFDPPNGGYIYVSAKHSDLGSGGISSATGASASYVASVITGHTYTVKAGGGGDFTTIQAAFDARSLSPGDGVVVYAGTYKETVTPSGNHLQIGTAVNPIVLMANPGDTVTIDGSDDGGTTLSRGFGFDLHASRYFILEGFHIQHQYWNSIYTGYDSVGLKIRGNSVIMCMLNDAHDYNRSAINTYRAKNVLVEYNTITNETGAYNSGNDTDGITAMAVNGGIYRYNNITITNQGTNTSSQHNDGVQITSQYTASYPGVFDPDTNPNALGSYNIEVDHNYISFPLQRLSQQGLYYEAYENTGDNGYLKIHHNTMYGNFNAYGIQTYPHDNIMSVVQSIYNNTVYNLDNDNSAPAKFYFGNNVLCKNNIFYSVRSNNNTLSFFTYNYQAPSLVNYNLYYNPNSPTGNDSVVYYNLAFRAWTNWTGLGFDANGIYGDPLFVDTSAPSTGGLNIQVSSTAKNKATSDLAWYNFIYNADGTIITNADGTKIIGG